MVVAVIESLGESQERDEVIAFTWTDLLQLEAACCSALQRSCWENRDFREYMKSDECCVVVLLLPRSALLLASVLACMKLQVGLARLMKSNAP